MTETEREKKRKYNMHKILPDEHSHSYSLVIAAPMPLLKHKLYMSVIYKNGQK